MEIKRSNPKVFQQLDLKIKELQSKQAKIGWFEASKYPDGTPVAYVAAIQEMGAPGKSIPPRPTMRPAAIETEKKVRELAAQGAKAILSGSQTADTVMEGIASTVQSQISKNIATLTEPPLSPITLGARKYRQQGKTVTGKTIGEIATLLKAGKLDLTGVSTKPLEDTGLLSATLTSVVEDATT